MITIYQAKQLRVGDYIYLKDQHYTTQRCRVDSIDLWKLQPNKVVLGLVLNVTNERIFLSEKDLNLVSLEDNTK